jgi:lipoprotein-releasing system permease protein
LYKLLLCWRYLRTRYLALACVISVMLGVATLIVVNSVMSGFSTKLRERLHGLLSDVLIEAQSMDGFAGPQEKMARIRNDPFLGPRIEAMTPTLEVVALLQFELPNGEMLTRPVRLIGVDPATRSAVGGFQEHLVRQAHSAQTSFGIPEEAQRRFQWQQGPAILAPPVAALAPPVAVNPADGGAPPPPAPWVREVRMPRGVILGNLIASYRDHDDEGKRREVYIINPGDTVILTTLSGQRLAPVNDRFVVVDYFKSEMSEYDNNYVFVPLDYLQHLRTMQDRVTSVEIKLKDYGEARAVVEKLRALFPPSQGYRVATWEEKQGPLLAAIAIERGILNVLLFLIIAVAGFGILAIFSMIVSEKTRDIGVLKALGASNVGVMKIFLGYGLLLGLVGAVLGTVLGVALTSHINNVEQFLTRVTGHELFDRNVYYFSEIPTFIQPWTVMLVNAGALTIAVLFSVLPALRAALLHPVRALRYE